MQQGLAFETLSRVVAVMFLLQVLKEEHYSLPFVCVQDAQHNPARPAILPRGSPHMTADLFGDPPPPQSFPLLVENAPESFHK
jgi:hypothetical protein